MKVNKTVDFEFAQEISFTDVDIAKILNVYKVSAKELLSGETPFEEKELHKLAQTKGIKLNELIK